jgi:hypothetical protein
MATLLLVYNIMIIPQRPLLARSLFPLPQILVESSTTQKAHGQKRNLILYHVYAKSIWIQHVFRRITGYLTSRVLD